MKIATWNVNSVRSRLEHLAKYLSYASPDILCLQETKVEDALFPFREIEEMGYRALVSGQKSYNGVALLAKTDLKEAVAGFPRLGPDHPLNLQKRLISAESGGIRVASVYVPNGEEAGSEKFGYKLAFMEELLLWVRESLAAGPLVLCGDFNVAPGPADLYNPEEREGAILFSPPEREGFARLIEAGLTDCFREKHPEPGRYSWWDYRDGGYWKKKGMRLDHILAANALRPLLNDSDIDERPRKWKKPSDHTPVWVDLDLERR